jgi:hypothetical protein
VAPRLISILAVVFIRHCESKTFELSYTVPQAVTFHHDVAELYWQFIVTIDCSRTIKVEIELPPRINTDQPTTPLGLWSNWGNDAIPSVILSRPRLINCGRNFGKRGAVANRNFYSDGAANCAAGQMTQRRSNAGTGYIIQSQRK